MNKISGLSCLIFLLAEMTFASEVWDPELDTGRTSIFLSEVEKDLILEVNKARANPAAYADEYLVPMREYFNGKLYQKPGGQLYRTNEGLVALEECILVMNAQKSLDVFLPSEGMSRAARDHVEDTGPKGLIGHVGSDGSTFDERISRYVTWESFIGENISYGEDNAQDIVIQLLVDDGVASRGHRDNLLAESFEYIGVAIGRHSGFDHICVMDFAVTAKNTF